MDPRGATVGFAWIAIAAISVMFLYMGGITWGTSLVVFLLVGVGFIVTFGVNFGLPAHQAQLDKDSPQTIALTQMSSELTALKTTVNDLTKKVEAIQKELDD
jgi:uncharacterized membrane protein YgaE (UPF0421/DUF939 family)